MVNKEKDKHVQRMQEKESSHLRVIKIIEAISLAERPMSPTDIALKLDIPKPTVHRIIGYLKEQNYIQTNPRGNLVPDIHLHDIAVGVIKGSQYRILRQSILKKLSEEVGETCGISTPDGMHMVYYDQILTSHPLRVDLPIGTRTPIYATASGKLYLSQFSKLKRLKILEHLPREKLAKNTLMSVEDFETEFKKIRKLGYAVDNEEFIDDMVAISAPILDKEEKVTAGVYIIAPTIRKSLDELLEYIPLLKKTAAELNGIYDIH